MSHLRWTLSLCGLIYFATAALCQDGTAAPQKPGDGSTQGSACILLFPDGSSVDGEQKVNAYLQSHQSLEDLIVQDCSITVSMAGKTLHGSSFNGVSARGIDFSAVLADGATFSGADLTRTNFQGAQLQGATFNGADGSLRQAQMDGSRLQGAHLLDIDMTGADLRSASLRGAEMRPHEIPDPIFLAQSVGLDHVRSPSNIAALEDLAKKLSDLGLDSTSRDVTYALQESLQARYREECLSGQEYKGGAFGDHPGNGRAPACFLYGVRAVAFDATCRFGQLRWRPLQLVALLAALWYIVFAVWLSVVRRPRITIIFKTKRGDDKAVALRRLVNRAYPAPRRAAARLRLALGLTVSCVFNLPFRDMDIGRWLRMVSSRDYEFHPRGAVRIFSGWLSLLCFYLLALWLLNCFSHPFQ